MTPKWIVRIVTLQRRQRKRAKARTGPGRLLQVVAMSLLLLLTSMLLSVSGVVGSVVGVYAYFAQDLPEPEQIEFVEENFETTHIYDRTGQVLLWEVIDPNAGDRVWAPLEEIPEHMICATIAIEDRTYWENPGVDPRGITRALISNLRGEQIQGGSSITQQLIKNVLIDPADRIVSVEGPEFQDYARKIREWILAVEITRRYDKEQILEWYLNTNSYGGMAYGIESAAQIYFGKPASELSLSEAATLAAIPQYPWMNPFHNPVAARERQNLVLDQMVLQGCITEAEAEAAKVEPWQLASPTEQFDFLAPHFSVYVRNELEEMFGPELVNRGGLRVYTTLDYDLQLQAECAAQTHVRRLSGEGDQEVLDEAIAAGCEAARFLPPLRASDVGFDHQVSNAAVVVIRPGTGEILTMVGSLDYWDESIDGHFNAALGLRQPGSSFKPFTYVTLLSQGYNAAHLFWDVRTAFEQPGQAPYVPENYDRDYHGPQRLRLALARSYNVPAVAALQLAGVDNTIRMAHRMGINSLDRGLEFYGLSLTLGGGEVRLLDLTYANTVYANGGVMIGQPIPTEQRLQGYRELDPVAVLRVENRNGNVLYEYTEPQQQVIFEPPLAYLITNILSDRRARWEAFGSPNPLELSQDRPAAAKTGSTNDWRDAWTVGFTPQIVTGVWVGNSNNSEMENLPGSKGAAPIWHAVMEYALQGEEIVPFTRPDGLEEHSVCAVSGLLPTAHCPTVTELFIPGTAPTERCDIHQTFSVNRETGRLCTVYTPPELCEEQVFAVYPREAADWLASLPEEDRPATPPTEYDTVYGPSPVNPEVAITQPTPYAYISSGPIEIIGNARGGSFAFYRLAFGEGLNPSEWIQIGPDHGNQVENNVLEYWDLTGLDGLYSLQLTVVNHDLSLRQATIQVTVDNTPPTINLTYPPAEKTYTLGEDEWVNVNAEVTDNYAIDRVEFYHNDEQEPFAVRNFPPYNVNWILSALGAQRFRAVVYDAAGNQAESQVVTIYVERQPE
ncbi:MAG: transglycosylase domain-containing protein [Anaerolineae bacterium]|nr:transglycosylase domain-containing protein [Anaerolineae bacterium]